MALMVKYLMMLGKLNVTRAKDWFAWSEQFCGTHLCTMNQLWSKQQDSIGIF